MARITLTEAQIIAFHPAFEAAGCTDTGAFKDIAGDWQAIPEESPMVATEETAADWIAARGKPAEICGDLLVFEDRVPGRKVESVTRRIYVLPTDFGTVAIVGG